MSITRKAGSADVSVIIRIIDSTDGTPETGVTSATGGLDLEYRREGAASTDLTESDLAAVDSAHSDGGIKHIGNGYYRVDLPDAAVAAGVSGVLVHGTATGMVVIGQYIDLVDYNPADALNGFADAFLARDLGSGTNAGTLDERTVRAALRFIRNKWSISGTALTVTKEDDATTAWTSTVTATAGADPITANDPA